MDDILVIEFGTDTWPIMYLVDASKMRLAKALVINAFNEFQNKGVSFRELVEEKWRLFCIWHKKIGDIRIPYEKRQNNYLADHIERMCLHDGNKQNDDSFDSSYSDRNCELFGR